MSPKSSSPREHGILCSDDTVCRILCGKQTVYVSPISKLNTVSAVHFDGLSFDRCAGPCSALFAIRVSDGTVHPVFPKERMGDLLWVREAHSVSTGPEGDTSCFVKYRADEYGRAVDNFEDVTKKYGENQSFSHRWRPSMYMPRILSRITVPVAEVWFQRMFDADCRFVRMCGFEDIDAYANFMHATYPAVQSDGWLRCLRWEYMQALCAGHSVVQTKRR